MSSWLTSTTRQRVGESTTGPSLRDWQMYEAFQDRHITNQILALLSGRCFFSTFPLCHSYRTFPSYGWVSSTSWTSSFTLTTLTSFWSASGHRTSDTGWSFSLPPTSCSLLTLTNLTSQPLENKNSVVLYFVRPDEKAFRKQRGKEASKTSVFGLLTERFVEVLISWNRRNRISLFWSELSNHLSRIVVTFHKHRFLLERAVVGIL